MNKKFNDSKWRREQLIEGKGYDLAKKYIAKLRQEFRKLSDEELDEFNKEIANAFGYKLESVNELNEAQADFSTDSYKIADSFTSSELKKLKADGKISVEVYNGASEIQRIWKQNHPTMKIGGGAYRKEILKQLN